MPIDTLGLLTFPSLFAKELALKHSTSEESAEPRWSMSAPLSSSAYDRNSPKTSLSALDLKWWGSTPAGANLESETLETETEPETSDNSLRSLPRHSLYSSSSPQEQLFMEQFYASRGGNGELFYGEKRYGAKNEIGLLTTEDESHYSSPLEIESELLTADEAQEAFKEIQYAALAGSKSDVDADERRRFDLWIKFNPALFKLLEATYGLTRDVNYGSYL